MNKAILSSSTMLCFIYDGGNTIRVAGKLHDNKSGKVVALYVLSANINQLLSNYPVYLLWDFKPAANQLTFSLIYIYLCGDQFYCRHSELIKFEVSYEERHITNDLKSMNIHLL